LQQLLRDIYDPASPDYRHYLIPEQFRDQFGASESDYATMMAFAQSNHLDIKATHPNRLVLDVSGTVTEINQAFHVTLRVYNHPTEHRTFFAPDSDPMVEPGLSVLHISGLDNYSLPHPNYKSKPLGQTPVATPLSGSGPSGTYAGNDFRNAYVPGTTLTGTGQSVGLLEFDGYHPGDITAYETQIGLTGGPQLVVVPVDGGKPRQLTFHSANDTVLGWTPDGKGILFSSTRATWTPSGAPRFWTACVKSSCSPARRKAATTASAAPAPCMSMARG